MLTAEVQNSGRARTARFEKVLSLRGFCAVFGLVLLARYFPVLGGWRTFSLRDYSIFSYPIASFLRVSFWHGEFPLWNPYNNCGIPFLAQWSSLALYPPSLIYVLLPMPWSLSFFCLLHLFFGAAGMYLLAQRLTGSALAGFLAGMVFGWNGFMTNCLMWPAFLAAMAWAPWILWQLLSVWRKADRAIAWAALAGACQMVTGAPEVIVVTWIIAGLLWLAELLNRRIESQSSIWRTICVVALVSALAAAQLLPFFDFLRISDRNTNYAGTTWSMPAWGWANFIVPLFRFYRSASGVFFQTGQDWTSSYYMGIGVLGFSLLAIVQVRTAAVRLLGLATVFFFFLAAGDHSFVYPLVRRVVPQLGFMRFPVKFLILPVFAFPLLAAFGIRWLELAANSPAGSTANRRASRLLSGIGAVLIAAAAGIMLFGRAHPLSNETAGTVLWSGISRVLLLAGIFGAAFSMVRSERRQATAAAALTALVLLDLLTHAPSQNPSVPPSVYAPGVITAKMQPPPEPGVNRAMMTRPTHDRLYGSMLPDPANDLMGRRLGMFGDLNLLDGIPSVDGFYSTYIKEERQVWAKLFFAKDAAQVSALADFLGVLQVSDPEHFLEWRRRDTAMPLVTLGQKPVFAAPEETLARIASAEFKPREVVYLPPAAKSAITTANSGAGTITNLLFTPREIRLTADLARASIIVAAQSYHHNWRATVDGAARPLWRANYNYQAIEVPAGRHEIRFRYEDRAFQFGLGISVAALLICILLLRQ